MVLLLFSYRGYTIRVYSRKSLHEEAIDYFFSVEVPAHENHPSGPKVTLGPFHSKTETNADHDPRHDPQPLDDVKDLARNYVDKMISFQEPPASSSILDHDPLAGR